MTELRSGLPDGIFHVVARGVYGAAIYRDDTDRRRFLRLLLDCVERHDWECYAYCLMTTHYHLVVDARRRDLSAGVQYLNGRHAQRFNRRHDRYELSSPSASRRASSRARRTSSKPASTSS